MFKNVRVLQVIATGCWLTMKESSLLLGALARSVPLSGTLGATVPLICLVPQCLAARCPLGRRAADVPSMLQL
jgi:hypothetical protein